MLTIELERAEAAAVMDLSTAVAEVRRQLTENALLRHLRLSAAQLPARVRGAIDEFRYDEDHGVLVVTGLPMDEEKLPDTPDRISATGVPAPSPAHDMAFQLFAALLGDPVGWATQQDGRIMHDIYPVQAFDADQIGWGSATELEWHTEDAFHPYRTDYLGLMCIRNRDQVETTFAEMRDLRLADSDVEQLSRPQYQIIPDDSHLVSNGAAVDLAHDGALLTKSRQFVRDQLERPEPRPLLFGDPRSPYLCVDPYYMREPDTAEAAQALDALAGAVRTAIQGVSLQPGQICFIDNFRAVHGRRAFTARLDGKDRWLRRLNIARDLRKSRDCRLSAVDRTIY
ncbi:guanitoxin biosynthesis L-enduracididine beta-hydroxylase GntD [Nocardia sp. CA-128927]|uniref:guanitoxin biosynthesis L-enduracididine beta-hydroxylase GntD n=1 Tax=Nocardia sp. CA-128927 TaxID=3239975 RepID=UPI003D97FEA1